MRLITAALVAVFATMLDGAVGMTKADERTFEQKLAAIGNEIEAIRKASSAVGMMERDVHSLHAAAMTAIACHSHAVKCRPSIGHVPFTMVGAHNDYSTPPGMKLLAVPGHGAGRIAAAGFPHAVVGGTGNDRTENFFDFYDHMGDEGKARIVVGILGAIQDNKVLFVSGFERDSDGGIVRHPDATGCVGVEDACVYEPFVITLPDERTKGRYMIEGTSGGTVKAAMALASVLAAYPEMSGPEIIRLAKECADRVPGLPGLGTLNVECMVR